MAIVEIDETDDGGLSGEDGRPAFSEEGADVDRWLDDGGALAPGD